MTRAISVDTGRFVVMEVHVIIHGHVREFVETEEDEIVLEFGQPHSIEDIIRELGLNPKLFMNAFVDGELRPLDYVVEEDCEVLLMSPTAGG